MSQESDVCCTTSMYDIQNRCIPDEIDLFYFKTCILTHNSNVIEQNINVSMFDILSVKEPHKFCLWYKFANSPISFWNRLNPIFTMAGHFFWHPTSATGTTTPPNTEIWSMSGAICKIIDIFWRLEDIGTRQNKINFIFWVWKLLTTTQGNDSRYTTSVLSITKPTSSTSERFNWTANLHVSM